MRITFYGLNIHELRKGERLDAFLGSNKGWFTRIRNELVKTLNHKHILLGDSFVSYLMPLGRRFVSEISRYYFRRGAFEDIEKIAAIIVTFSAVGRAGLLTVKQSGIPSMKFWFWIGTKLRPTNKCLCLFLMIIMTLH